MRAFIIGLLIVVPLSLSILSLRPGGIRRQLRFAARRFRIVLVLGGVYLAGSLIIRLAFPTGPVSEYGPPALAILLAVVFLLVGRDPVSSRTQSSHR